MLAKVEKVEQQAGFDVQVIGFTTSESTREEHHVYDVPFTTVRRLQKFQLRPRDNNPKFKMDITLGDEKKPQIFHSIGDGKSDMYEIIFNFLKIF